MSPRKYVMTKRADAKRATRERIVAATLAAHRDLGIQSTSWDEIARRAGVGSGTVYRHFASIDELLPACGEVVERTLALPQGDGVARVFAGARSSPSRIERLVREIFGVYERGAPFIENIRRERRELPALEPWHQQVEMALDALTAEALKPLGPGDQAWGVARAFIDLDVWNAFQSRGFTTEQAAEAVVEAIGCALRRNGTGSSRAR
jgi:AcrR family transcriptional regulator